MGRPPIADDRLERNNNGHVIIRLIRPWHDGTTHIKLTPLELMARLTALVPPVRAHQITYHGVFAPRARLRAKIVPQRAEQPTEAILSNATENHAPTIRTGSTQKMSWARLMRRVFDIDVLECPRCSGLRSLRMRPPFGQFSGHSKWQPRHHRSRRHASVNRMLSTHSILRPDGRHTARCSGNRPTWSRRRPG